MSFINLYQKDTHTYWNSKIQGNVIYSIGTIQIPVTEPILDNWSSKESFIERNAKRQVVTSVSFRGLITKTDSNGQVIWEKAYKRPDGKHLYFDDLVFCDNGDIIVLGVHDNDNGTSLYRIDSLGNEVWVKYLLPFTNGQGATGKSNPRLLKVAAETYIVQVDENFQIGNALQPENFIYKINGSGQIVAQQRIIAQGGGKFHITGINKHAANSNIILFGERITDDLGDIKHVGIIMQLDINLEIVDHYTLLPLDFGDERVIITDAYVTNHYFIVFGIVGSQNPENFLAKIIPNIYQVNISLSIISGHIFNECYFNSSFIYLQKNDRADTYISKLNHNFNVLWNKNFDSGNYNYKAIRQVTPTKIVLANYFIGLLNLNLESCLTKNVESIKLGSKTLLQTPKLDFQLNEGVHAFTDYPIAESTVTSKIERICPTIIDDDFPSITDNTLLQSPNFYLQAAGSIGDDSARGIHLRWIFAGALGDNHLPKGDYATTEYNFNKPNDFVRLYRAKYVQEQFLLDFELPPQAVNDSQKFWLYKFNDDTRIFFVYFRNAIKYNTVRLQFDPFTQPLLFIKAYGNELIEVENKRELFFATELYPEFDPAIECSLQIEVLTVASNTLLAGKGVAYRNTYLNSDVGDIRIVSENGRSIRFKANFCFVTKLYFEFYSDFITKTTENGDWSDLGNYALSLEIPEVFNRLEPEPIDNPVNGKWLRYNNNAYTKIANYQDKWNGPVESWNRNIEDVVNQYINLSDSATNPRALEFVTINLANESDIITVDETEQEEGSMEVSNLDMLRVASYDYHIARMLGLGTLDVREEVFLDTFIYVGAYTTLGDLGIEPVGEINHLAMTLPTSCINQRLPLPIDLDQLVPGILDEEGNVDTDVSDINGYSFDGKKRYISIFNENLIEGTINPPFFVNSDFLDTSTFTFPVYAGLENRIVLPGGTDDEVWIKPELSHKNKYLNIDATSVESYETTPINLPEEGKPLFIDIQSKSGLYYYAAYGINWFSRATSSEIVLDITTDIKPFNSLLPPSNVRAWLIRPENPLMYTSQNEQDRFVEITSTDKTLVRLMFDYNAEQDLISYQIPIETALPDSAFETDTNLLFPDEDEVLGDEVEINFRTGTPRIITAKAWDVDDDLPNPLLAKILTMPYFQASTFDEFPSELPAGTTFASFVGSIFMMGNQQFVVHSVEPGTEGLSFTVYKQNNGNNIFNNPGATISSQDLQAPVIQDDGYFTVVENMQNEFCWGNGNPHTLKVKIGHSWNVHRELVKLQNDNGLIEKYIEKTRGFWQEATIEKFLEDFTFEDTEGILIEKIQKHRGIYKITFDNFSLENHEQMAENVEWFNGYVRLFTSTNYINGDRFESRRPFTVFKTENIGSSSNLVLYINDPSFMMDNMGEPHPDNDDIVIGESIKVNYYPSYKVFLYYAPNHNLTEPIIMPEEGEGTRISIFGLRTVDNDYTTVIGNLYKSRFSIPAVLLAQEVIEAKAPDQPLGGLFATRPDFYGKSTYTFTTKYQHKPHGVSFYRADNEGLLTALYENETINQIKSELKPFGGNNEEYLTNRWNNFFNWVELETAGGYESFPITVGSATTYQFPLPDKIKLFQGINQFITFHNDQFSQNVDLIDGEDFGNIHFNFPVIPAAAGQNDEITFAAFIKEAVMNVFIPLTEVPIIYKYVKTEEYTPTNRKQKIRDENGYLIKPPADVNNPPAGNEFEMAPMMKVIAGAPNHETQYTDFTLEGTSNNLYFYAVKEISSLMKMGEFSPVLGPIKLINSNPPEAPKVKSVMPELENRALGISPALNFEITAYPEVQNIKRINLYRTLNRLDAESVQSMDLIKVIDIEAEMLTDEAIWPFVDNFQDLAEVPFGSALYYRISVSRRIRYEDLNQDVIIEYAPSQATKILATMMVETYKAVSPTLDYFSEPLTGTILEGIVLHWEKTCFNGKYHLYKMNNQGNWAKIHEVSSNDENIYVPLEDTDVGNRDLVVIDEQQNPIYHHFKVTAENTAGMMSTEENILTIYNAASWQDVGSIGEMIIGATFVVR